MVMLIDATTAEHARGIGVVIDGILTALSISRNFDGTVAVGPETRCPTGVDCRRIGLAATRVGRLAYQRLLLPLDLALLARRGTRVDRVLLLDAYAPLVRTQRDVRYAALVHDVLPLTHPELWSAPQRVVKRTAFRSLRASKATIFTSTDHNAQQLTQMAGLRAHVVSFGCGQLSDEEAEAARNAALCERKQYLVYVGAFEPRKDVQTAIAAVERAATTLANDTALVLAGGGSPEHATAIKARIDASPARERIEVVTDPGPDRTIELIRGAAALLFPSRAEGFGLPILEALALGTPVVASDLPEIRSWAQNAVHYAPAGKPDAWVEPIETAMRASDTERRSGQSLAGSFRWSRCADGLVDF